MKILAYRFSSLGDVALTVPVIKRVLDQNKEVEIIFVTRPRFSAVFPAMERLKVVEADVDDKYKGLVGLGRLNKMIAGFGPFHAMADLHDVLRTTILKQTSPSSTLIATIDKGRSEKKLLTRKTKKELHPIKSTVERYADVFRQLGLKLELDHQRQNYFSGESSAYLPALPEGKILLGIAPFASRIAKALPFDTWISVLKILNETGRYHFVLFGNGKVEEMKIAELKMNFPSIGHYPVLDLVDEIILMSKLRVMISMDSANMHLASLAGTRVISIWGGTHPFAGFLGYAQQMEDVIQKDLFCRPCSVFGNKECYRKDHLYECFDLDPAYIAAEIEKRI